ncbi:MAG: ABC transporter permease [Candidatus Micrarchaeota archaeon]|nr:ABC transporter permease [Candidatus Micrarchaeota archaeon]
MSLLQDTFTLYKREMLIFKSNARVNLIRSVMFPLIIILFFGNIGNSISSAPVVIVNYANNPQSLSFIGSLQSNNFLSITKITDQATALSLLKNGNVQIVIIILPTFPSSQPGVPGIQVYYSNTQIAVTGFALPLIQSAAAKYSSSVQQINPTAEQKNPSGEVSSNALYASAANYKDFLVGGIIPMVVVFNSLFAGGISLISDRQLGNIKAFMITPINKNAIVLSKILAGATTSIIVAILALTIGLLDGASIAGGALTLLIVIAVAVTLSLAFMPIAVMLASRVNRVDAYAIFSQAVGLPLWFVGGGIIPIQSLPSWLAAVAVFDPLMYANTIIRAMTLQGFIQLSTLLINFAVLIVFAAVMIYFSFRVFNASSQE